MKLSRRIAVLGLIAVMATALVACGDDDDDGAAESTSGSGEAVAPPPNRAFDGLKTALEPEGLDVERMPQDSLDGAEAGVTISGDRSGSARSFASEADAQEYVDESAGGDKTEIVGTVVIQAASQEDVDFFVDAYEGG